MGIGERTAGTPGEIGPAIALVVTTLAVWGFGLADRGVSIVGQSQGLPRITLPPLDFGLWTQSSSPRC